MKKLLYISNARLPSLMAHGLQIIQNCEAFADTPLSGEKLDVTLWCPWRYVPPEERSLTSDVWSFYSVKRNFRLRRLPSLDLVWLLKRDSGLRRALFYLQFGSFALVATICAIFTPADVYYSRDPLTLLLLGLVKPRAKLVYEAHRLNQPGMGAWLQRQVLRRCGVTVPVTPPLRDALAKLQANAPVQSTLIVAHDGIRQDRFADVPDQAAARQRAGWSPEAFIVGYVGRLKTMGMDKGLDTLIQALALLPEPGVSLAIVGGPEDMVVDYREQWRKLGLPDTLFLYAGQVDADDVPQYLSAFDVCAMPFPWTEHFALHASPIKLFEYMASGRALVASDLPAYADVVTHEVNALLVPPADAAVLAAAIWRLRQDRDLRQRLAKAAYERVMTGYTWAARARQILQQVAAVQAKIVP